jgi:hypothetical protein
MRSSWRACTRTKSATGRRMNSSPAATIAANRSGATIFLSAPAFSLSLDTAKDWMLCSTRHWGGVSSRSAMATGAVGVCMTRPRPADRGALRFRPPTGDWARRTVIVCRPSGLRIRGARFGWCFRGPGITTRFVFAGWRWRFTLTSGRGNGRGKKEEPSRWRACDWAPEGLSCNAQNIIGRR